jgi:hypothetical protein
MMLVDGTSAVDSIPLPYGFSMISTRAQCFILSSIYSAFMTSSIHFKTMVDRCICSQKFDL